MMYRRMNPKDLEKVIEELKKSRETYERAKTPENLKKLRKTVDKLENTVDGNLDRP